MAANNAFLVTFRISVDEVFRIVRLLKDQAEFVSAVRESVHAASYVAADGEEKVLKVIDNELVAYAMVGQIDLILGDPPTDNYECGYLDALLFLYRLGRGFIYHSQETEDARTRAAERLISNIYVPSQSSERSRRQ
jgi:hypothetical protein